MNSHDCAVTEKSTAVFIKASSENNEIENLYALCCYSTTSLLKKAPPDFTIHGKGWVKKTESSAVTNKHITRYMCGTYYSNTPIENCTFKHKPNSTALPKDIEKLMPFGKKIFEEHCSNCHKIDGLGMPPVVPALKGSKVATGPIEQEMDVVTHGVPGTIMLSFNPKNSDDPLSAEELAAVMTYIRNEWGNNDTKKYGKSSGGKITAEQIKQFLK